MKIAVVGTGYVGLVTGTCLAETGNFVTCVDIDKDKVDKMKSGVVPIYEPGLETLFERNIKHNRLSFTTSLEDAVKDAEIIFLALPTPPGEDGSADLSYILGVADDLGKIITDYKVIVDKSTVPVGTADKVHAAIVKNSVCEFDVVSNPEFLREGFAIDDFMKPDRIVIGCSSTKAESLMNTLYQPYVRQGNPIIFMDKKSAELTKYAANSFLATKISFMNEIANICETLGADVDKVRIGIGSDDRIGKRFLFPGIGYGGSCFPKDVQALVKTSEQINYDFKILKAVMDVNANQKKTIVAKILKHYNGDISGKTFALWGLAFKPNTDDVREAPALEIINELTAKGAKVTAYDPEAMDNIKNAIGDIITYASGQYESLNSADALIIATEWAAFRTPDFTVLKSNLKDNVIFDGRNLFDVNQMKQLGFDYYSVGREAIIK
jgi:UDPglucose 6-dehydrogenase